MDSRLVNYQQKVNNEYIAISPLLNKYADEYPLVSKSTKTINGIFDTKIKSLEPQIMVYGIYNAGKSSIINALIREEKAKVADVPTTDTVDMYEWNGYQIADTPGVGAPIKHEEVTNEHLKKADVVLFVMSTSGSFEYGDNYKRMKDIINAGKRVLIILNDKAGFLGEDDGQRSLAIIKTKIVQNMKQIGIESNISDIQDKYQIIVVNADDAKTAIEDKDGELYSASNMPELETAITRELKNTNSFNVLKNAIKEVENELTIIVHELEKGENKEELKDLSQILETIRDRRRYLRQEMQSFISNKTIQLGKTLPAKIWLVKDNEEKVNEIIKRDINAVEEIVQKKINDEFLEINDEIKAGAEEFIKKLKKIKAGIDPTINVNQPDVIEPLANVNPGKSTLDKLIEVGEKLYEIYEKLPVVDKTPPFPDRIPIPKPSPFPKIPGVQTSLPKGSSSLNGVVAGEIAKVAVKNMPSALAKTTVGGLASQAVPYIGQILTAIQILGTVFGDDGENERLAAEAAAANERERLIQQAEEQARQELKQNCEFMAEDVKDNLILNVNEVIRNTLGEFENLFTKQIANSTDGEQKLTNDINIISGVINNLDHLRIEIEV